MQYAALRDHAVRWSNVVVRIIVKMVHLSSLFNHLVCVVQYKDESMNCLSLRFNALIRRAYS